MASFSAAVKEIDSFAKLNTGWDYGRGVPSTPITCARARTVLALLHGRGAVIFDVAPGRAGGITVAAVDGAGNEIEIHCGSDGLYDIFALDAGKEVFDLDALSISELDERIGGISWLSKKSYIWSTANVICLTWEGSQAKPLSRLQTVLASRLSASNVPLTGAAASARTFSSMPERTFAPIRQFTGGSDSRNLMLA